MSFSKNSSDFSVVQYLQNAILQLCNDQVAYTETLHVLGVLCITADNEKSEFVIKINSTLKRLNSLTPPKETSPGFKSKSLLMLSPEEDIQVDGDIDDDDDEDGGKEKFANDSMDNVQIISHYDNMSYDLKKIRGRKQSNPAKVQNLDDPNNAIEKLSTVDDDVVTVDSVNEEFLSDSEQMPSNSKHDLVLPQLNNSSPSFKVNSVLSKDGAPSIVDSSDGECLDLSSKSSKPSHENINKFVDKLNCSSNNIWNFPYSHLSSNISNLNLPLLQMGFMQNSSLNEYIPANIGNTFNAFINANNQSAISSYRKILPATPTGNADFKQHCEILNNDNNNNNNSNNINHKYSFNDMIIDKFENRTEEDYLLDCLNVSGKKRRRRSLEDALTVDEIHEYLGSRDQPMEESYICKVCEHASPDLLKYFHHTLSIHKSFICHQCGRCFTTKSSLLRHRPIHTGLRRFACSICQKAFYRKDKCKAHIKKHAEVQGDSEASNNVQVL